MSGAPDIPGYGLLATGVRSSAEQMGMIAVGKPVNELS